MILDTPWPGFTPRPAAHAQSPLSSCRGLAKVHFWVVQSEAAMVSAGVSDCSEGWRMREQSRPSSPPPPHAVARISGLARLQRCVGMSSPAPCPL